MKLKQKLIYAVLGFLVGNAILLLVFYGWSNLKQSDAKPEEISFNQVLTKINNKEIKAVTIKEDSVVVTEENDKKYFSVIDQTDAPREAILSLAKEYGIQEVKIEPTSNGWFWLVLLNSLPLALVVIFALIIIGLLIGIFVRLNKNNSIK